MRMIETGIDGVYVIENPTFQIGEGLSPIHFAWCF